MLKFIVPDSKEKIELQIKALEGQIKRDINDKDRKIHRIALNELKKALCKY